MPPCLRFAVPPFCRASVLPCLRFAVPPFCRASVLPCIRFAVHSSGRLTAPSPAWIHGGRRPGPAPPTGAPVRQRGGVRGADGRAARRATANLPGEQVQDGRLSVDTPETDGPRQAAQPALLRAGGAAVVR
ncbi:hypothetical protein E1292_26845 [Nonomuraea deserti]|uniref:Uncharacterized protein n=1 Tax=Nonomuraea deserti TaxID=1848322 RepID=A0A4R4V799_9ACTN|nr:hypothetical protein E1292_26845 [Nonomuraea deserti]